MLSRSLSQKEIEEKELLKGRSRMSSTLSEAAEEWKNRQLKKKRSIKVPSDDEELLPPSPPPDSIAPGENSEELTAAAPPPPKPSPKPIPGYMQSTKASRSGRHSGDMSLETNEPVLASSARAPRSPRSPRQSSDDPMSPLTPNSPNAHFFPNKARSFSRASSSDGGSAGGSVGGSFDNPSPPPVESPDSARTTRSAPASSAPTRRPGASSPRRQSGAGTWSKKPMWAQAQERNKAKKAAAAAAGLEQKSNTPPRSNSTTRSSPSFSPKTPRSASTTRASPSFSPKASSPRSSSPRASMNSSSSFRVNRDSSSKNTSSSINRSRTPLKKTNSSADMRPVRFYTTEDRMPIKCAKVCVEYIRVWLLVSAATPKELRSSRLARKIIDESTISKSKKGTSSNTTYRKLMRLVHPDSLVTLKGDEPTTALALAMAGGLLRTFNAANEILDQHDKANDHAAAACLLTPGDYPVGGPPSARKRNATLAIHLFILAEKLATDPTQSSTDKAAARLTLALESLREVVPGHRAGMIGDMLAEETKRAEDAKMEAKLAAKRAAIEAKADLARNGPSASSKATAAAAEDDDDDDEADHRDSPNSVAEDVPLENINEMD